MTEPTEDEKAWADQVAGGASWMRDGKRIDPKTIMREVPPQHIVEAAEMIGRWFANQGIKDWELGPCRARYPKG